MNIVECRFTCNSRKDEFPLYVLGDLHIGALNCAERAVQQVVQRIKQHPNARFFLGGDIVDAVILGDQKRFDVNVLPGWMLTGKGDAVRAKIGDILKAQIDRAFQLLDPIRDRCLGVLEGNHEYTVFKHHNRDIMPQFCKNFNAPNLTDCAFVRLSYKHDGPKGKAKNITLFLAHGHGGGRTSGAEPMKLFKLAADKDVDIVLTGHSHTFHIHPPIPMLYINTAGRLPEEPRVREKYAANWGAYVYTYATGPSSYASRANYPVRPMYTVETLIRPCKGVKHSGEETGEILMNAVKL